MAKVKATRTILLVEDKNLATFPAAKILRKNGYEVIEAAHGIDALERCKAMIARVDLLLTDIFMPKMNGITLYETMQKLHPKIPVIFMSGYAPDAAIYEAIKAQGLPYLPKPFTFSTFKHAVTKALAPAIPSPRLAGRGKFGKYH